MYAPTPGRGPALPHPFLWFAAGCIIASGVYGASIQPLLHQWLKFDHSLGHAFALFLIICGWLASIRREFDAVARAPSIRGAALVGLLSMAWVSVALGDIDLLEQLVLIPLFAAIAVWVAGWRSALTVVPPLSMLVFCIPVLDEANDQLVDLSTWAVGNILEMLVITSHMQGNSIILPAGTVVIAGGCSGLRYIVVGLAMANLASTLNRLGWRHQLLANLLALALMIGLNWLRITVIVVMAYVTNMQTSLVQSHEGFGWVLFAAALIPLLIYIRSAPQKVIQA